MKRGLIIGGIVLLVAVIVTASIMSGGDKGEKVYAEAVKARNIEAIVTAPGEINPKVKVNISANVIGKIDKLYFVEGQTVHKGQRLVDLERPSYAALRDRAAAEVINRRIEVQRARNALATADMTYKRAQSLRAQGIQAQELFDQAQLAHANATAAYASAEQGVHQAEAGLQQAENDLSHTIINSPIDGKVVQLNAHQGEVVITGTMNNLGSVIAVVADLSQILVEADVGETEVVGIRVGQKAKVHVDAVADKEYQGHVVEIGSSASTRAGSSGLRYFKVKVQIDDSDDRLRPGMTSQVSIITSTAGSTPSVPIQCVVERVPPSLAKGKNEEDLDENLPKRKYVFVVKDGKAKMIEVKTGVSDATHVAIASGVTTADQVITGPFRLLKKLKDGDKVEITKEETSTKSGETK
jgi:HlyD family secretion protein